MVYGTSSDISHERARDENIIGSPRVVRDPAGDMITIVERRAENIAGARAPRCLVFSTDRGFIRLWDYPADWTALTDLELIALSEFRRGANGASAAKTA